MDQAHDGPPPAAEDLGTLAQRGSKVAAYLHSIPDDETERAHLLRLLQAISEAAQESRCDRTPRITDHIRAVMEQPPTEQRAGLVREGFERLQRVSTQLPPVS